MDEPTSVQPLTEENMKKLRVWQIAKFLPTESLATSDFLPIDRLEKAKCRVYKFLSRLKDIGDEGIRIREAEAVYLGTAVAESDLQDHSFWEAKLENLEQTYGPGIKITRAKRAVCHYMRLLHKFGPEGRKILADHELCLVGKDDVCYRGSADPEPDLQDPTYWVAQKEDLWSKHQVLWRARYPPPPTVVYIPPNTEERMKSVEQENLVEKDDSSMALRWAWARRKRMIRAWVSELIGASLSGSESPIFYDPPDQTTAGDIEDSISYRSAELPYFRWHDAYRGVYERMAALWHLGGEGCEIVANDELRVVDKYDVRYRRSRGPKPNLKDPRYWEAKWEYFTDKYISLLQSTKHSSQVLAELTLDPEKIPIPRPSSSVLSPIPSRVESLQPSSESIRAEEVKTAKEALYNILTFKFFRKEGRKFLEDDDIYVAGRYDVRYRHTVGPQPNLQDPQYWVNKIGYFYGHYLTSLPEEEQNFTRRLIVPESESTLHSERPLSGGSTPLLHMEDQPHAPTTGPLECQTATAHDPMDKENCAPCSGIAITQVTELPKASKRKRGNHSDDTDQAEDQVLHPTKRSKPEVGQASETRAATTGSSPAAAPSPKTPTRDAIVRQPRVSDPTSDREAGQSSAAPVVVDGIEDRARQMPPQRRRRQRKTYEKERTSRRLAGQSPEFGLLPERGEEPRPYEPSSRRAATIGRTNISGPRSGRISKKPAAVKSTRSRATPKPTEGGASRQRRPKRN